MTRRAQRRLKVRSASPMRVPPPQSWTSRATRVNTAAPRCSTSGRVTRVSCVANRNASTRAALCARP